MNPPSATITGREEPQAEAIHHRALEQLEFIRSTISRTSTFTALPGRGGMILGLVGLLGAWIAWHQPTPERWLLAWTITAVTGFLVAAGFVAAKARRAGIPLLDGPGRKFALALLPSLMIGAALTRPLFDAGEALLLPSVWLMLYGGAVIAAGVFSVRLVPILGLCFLALGLASLIAPPGTGDLFMAAGFGGLHLVFGAMVARRYGG